MNLNCIIVDDEPVARKVLEEYIGDIDFLTLVGKAENPIKAKSLLKENAVDLMFLDINMPGVNGIDFIKYSNSLPLTILTTAYPDYAIESYELDVLDYLLKPISEERFLKACIKAKEYYVLKKADKQLLTSGDQYFFVKCDGKIEKILLEELVYIEALQNYVLLHTDDRKLMVYLTIKVLEEQLPADKFIKIHKSTIINIAKIRSIHGNEIDLGKSTVTISQGLFEDVMNSIVKDKMIRR